MLRIDVGATAGSGDINEDVVGWCDGAAWVIDGASGVGASLLEEETDATWLAREADRQFKRLLTANPAIPSAELVREASLACLAAFESGATRSPEGPHEHPSAAFAMVRAFGSEVELLTLGDCRIACRGSDGGAELFGTTDLAPIEAQTIARVASLLSEHPEMHEDELRARLMPLLSSNRALMNTEGGYWVLGTSPDAAEHLDLVRRPAGEGDEFAIASDGFLRLAELFEAADAADLLAIGTASDFDRWLERLRALEAEPGSRSRFPRVKLHDDVAFIRCTLTEGG
jgi:serine/threonine protein phosphatase PrpC